MNILFAYYSLEGNCRELSTCMAEAVGGDLLEVLPKTQTVRPKGFMRYLEGGKESLRKDTPELLPLKKNPVDYELVFFGAPVWAWNMAAPARSFLTNVDWRDRRVALFCMHGGGKGGTLGNMRKLVDAAGGSVVAMADFKDLRGGKGDATRERAREWAREVVGE